ncbi:MAG TPA: hypothetical protein VF624_01490 [Tepidisphaeraceae bacterium]|jgi:hypothetical protein
MITLDAGNVLLKGSHRKQLMSRLKRTLRLGDRIGQFVMKLSMRRVRGRIEMHATVHDRFGDFTCRTRSSTWTDAVHDIVRMVQAAVHGHGLRRAAVA